MLFLVPFGTLALGFYGQVNTSVEISNTDFRKSEAQTAAESGLQFIRYKLAYMPLYSSSTNPTASAFFNYIVSEFSSDPNYTLANTANMVDAVSSVTYNPNQNNDSHGNPTFAIPGATAGTGGVLTYHWMRLGTSAGTTCILVQLVNIGSPATPTVVITALGKSDGDTPLYRALQYNLLANTSTASNTSTTTSPWQAPNGSIISYSPIQFSGGGVTINANITAVTNSIPLTMTGGGGNKISGTFSYPSTNTNPQSSWTGVAGNGNSVATVVQTSNTPTMPTFDTTVFSQFVPSSTATGSTVIKSGTNVNNYVGNDIRIKAGANPSFSNATINGVIYIESPNTVTIGGGSKINGVIVTDNNQADSASNTKIILNNGSSLNPTGSISTNGMSATDKTNIAALQVLTTGSMVVVPNAYVEFSGGLSATNTAAIVGQQLQFDNIGPAINFKGIILQTGSSAFKVLGGIGLNASTGTTTWPGMNVSSTSTTTSYSTTMTLNQSTYEETSAQSFLH